MRGKYHVYSPMFNLFCQHKILYLLTIASFGAIGALWEVAEWMAEQVLALNVVPSLADTIIDLIMDSLGAVFAALVSFWALREWMSFKRTTDRAFQSECLSQCD